jgi:hypothetical protein
VAWEGAAALPGPCGVLRMTPLPLSQTKPRAGLTGQLLQNRLGRGRDRGRRRVSLRGGYRTCWVDAERRRIERGLHDGRSSGWWLCCYRFGLLLRLAELLLCHLCGGRASAEVDDLEVPPGP